MVSIKNYACLHLCIKQLVCRAVLGENTAFHRALVCPQQNGEKVQLTLVCDIKKYLKNKLRML